MVTSLVTVLGGCKSKEEKMKESFTEILQSGVLVDVAVYGPATIDGCTIITVMGATVNQYSEGNASRDPSDHDFIQYYEVKGTVDFRCEDRSGVKKTITKSVTATIGLYPNHSSDEKSGYLYTWKITK